MTNCLVFPRRPRYLLYTVDVSPDDFAVWAMPIFLVAIAVEVIMSRRYHPERYAMGTALSDMAVGGVYQAIEVCIHGGLLWVYATAFQHAAPVQLDATAPLTWVFGLLAVDFLFYWWHRFSHVVNVLWAVHGVHHQGEDFNLAVALRQPAFEPLTWFLFYLPLAVLGVPPEVYIGSYAVNRFYQFWIHTEYIGKGPRWVEWIFNTASHHRVHHGVNEAYLDKNYGAVLIVWDRLFGTFEEEGVRPTYGTTVQLGSYNPVWANLQHFVVCGRLFRASRTWRDRIRVWFAHPAWRPEGMDEQLETSKLSAQARLSAAKHRPRPSRRLGWYVLAQFVAFAPLLTVLVELQSSLAWWELGVGALVVIVGQAAMLGLVESRPWGVPLELMRLVGTGTLTVWLAHRFASGELLALVAGSQAVYVLGSGVVLLALRRALAASGATGAAGPAAAQ